MWLGHTGVDRLTSDPYTMKYCTYEEGNVDSYNQNALDFTLSYMTSMLFIHAIGISDLFYYFHNFS